METKQNCEHDQLYFASGGFYLCCPQCGVSWVATKNYDGDGDKDLDYNRQGNMDKVYISKNRRDKNGT